jgi:hypothetical protein
VLLNRGGALTSSYDPTVVVGVNAIATPSPNVSIVVQKPTVLAGRQYRGRMFSPACNIDELEVDAAGIIVNASVSVLQGWWNFAYASLVGNQCQPYLLHGQPLGGGPIPTPSSVIGFPITPLVGSNRRRIR